MAHMTRCYTINDSCPITCTGVRMCKLTYCLKHSLLRCNANGSKTNTTVVTFASYRYIPLQSLTQGI